MLKCQQAKNNAKSPQFEQTALTSSWVAACSCANTFDAKCFAPTIYHGRIPFGTISPTLVWLCASLSALLTYQESLFNLNHGGKAKRRDCCKQHSRCKGEDKFDYETSRRKPLSAVTPAEERPRQTPYQRLRGLLAATTTGKEPRRVTTVEGT